MGTVTTADGSVVGAPALSIWCSLAAMTIAILYLAKRNETNAQLLTGAGIVAVVASLLSIVLLFEKISDTRSILVLPGLRLDLSPGAGPWIQDARRRRHPDRWDVGGADRSTRWCASGVGHTRAGLVVDGNHRERSNPRGMIRACPLLLPE